MRRGPKLKPELARYSEAGYVHGVYVLETGALIKVGCSRFLARRLRELHVKHAAAGEKPGRFRTFATDPYEHFHAEGKALLALGKVTQPILGRLEYFDGITFDEAVAVIERALSA